MAGAKRMSLSMRLGREILTRSLAAYCSYATLWRCVTVSVRETPQGTGEGQVEIRRISRALRLAWLPSRWGPECVLLGGRCTPGVDFAKVMELDTTGDPPSRLPAEGGWSSRKGRSRSELSAKAPAVPDVDRLRASTTTHRLGNSLKPLTSSLRLTISKIYHQVRAPHGAIGGKAGQGASWGVGSSRPGSQDRVSCRGSAHHEQ